ncbi:MULTISPECIES: lycopene cyclase domain-containing protein [unclassified Rathayibacter]|uniref:lycopene cyclase domain-containing protein n=1 Tax=unclassified Rathayibacter TaxID=2609250 RepID=UPI00188BD832|nr:MULTISPECIES: lycopene cyclase domain-containing protein [unclassified Rathayibacter]MBF4461409.1 lycopene cyclase domain-containing protein [Rathayibacter sp. VKM Ac-2879]MBF4502820.1 lycopene cyclase domain-containing protein [Rathayibacter sp. VKM Ac-2878]
MTYALLNAAFLAVVLVLLLVALRRRTLLASALFGTLAVLLVMTAIFDNVMIGVGLLVAYDDTLISGIRIGVAPIEDFAYAVAAALALPALWSLLPARRSEP